VEQVLVDPLLAVVVAAAVPAVADYHRRQKPILHWEGNSRTVMQAVAEDQVRVATVRNHHSRPMESFVERHHHVEGAPRPNYSKQQVEKQLDRWQFQYTDSTNRATKCQVQEVLVVLVASLAFVDESRVEIDRPRQ